MSPVEDTLRRHLGQIYVINLANRTDRRREMEAELDRLGVPAQSPLVSFFPAVRPDSAPPFPSIGARGCFLSHLEVLKQARTANHAAILILEDDAAFSAEHIAHMADMLPPLSRLDWAIAHLGYRIALDQMPGADQALHAHWRRLPAETGVQTTHAMLINQRAFTLLIDYLEQMMARPPGHPDGGPMHVDGAYSWFRRDHPECLALVTPGQYVIQRASRSDIAPSGWKDRIPLLGLARRIKNRLR